jgi:hypothetical protein
MVFAGNPLLSLILFAALPVGAAREIFNFAAFARRTISPTTVVFPTRLALYIIWAYLSLDSSFHFNRSL